MTSLSILKPTGCSKVNVYVNLNTEVEYSRSLSAFLRKPIECLSLLTFFSNFHIIEVPSNNRKIAYQRSWILLSQTCNYIDGDLFIKNPNYSESILVYISSQTRDYRICRHGFLFLIFRHLPRVRLKTPFQYQKLWNLQIWNYKFHSTQQHNTYFTRVWSILCQVIRHSKVYRTKVRCWCGFLTVQFSLYLVFFHYFLFSCVTLDVSCYLCWFSPLTILIQMGPDVWYRCVKC